MTETVLTMPHLEEHAMSPTSEGSRFRKIDYTKLNSRQKEIYNFQKVAAVLADYGFNCIKLADDWLGADFIAYHRDAAQTLRVQLKSRLTIEQKYIGKALFVAFPAKEAWYLVEHDELVRLAGEITDWLNQDSWTKGKKWWCTDKPSKAMLEALKDARL